MTDILPRTAAVFPGDPLEVLALGAIRRFSSIRERVRAIETRAVLLSDPIAAELVESIIDNRQPCFAPWQMEDAEQWAAWADDFAPTNEVWAIYILDRLIAERAALLIVPTLRWGADALDYGWRGVDEVRAIIVGTFALAEGRAA